MKKILDNQTASNSVGITLQKIIKQQSKLSFVSAYFTIYAYQKLQAELDGIHDLRLLLGDPEFVQTIDPNKNISKSFKIEKDQGNLTLDNQLQQKKFAIDCAKWIENKVKIKTVKDPKLLHGKLYHVQNAESTHAILGSSNFTAKGLGFGRLGDNIELNLDIHSPEDQKELLRWFDSLWDDKSLVVDVKKQVLEYLKNLYAENTPHFIYMKTLYHLFKDALKEDVFISNTKSSFYKSEVWNRLYDFQKDGVRGAINKILKYNGCILADSVGLGKTFEALAIIKYFESLNSRVLVLCPKKLSNNWTKFQAIQNQKDNIFVKDQFGYAVLYHTDLGRTTGKSLANHIELDRFNWGAYDLVVIDESHNFRGNPMETMKNGQKIMNRAQWLMEEIIKSGVKTKVLMLSATPVNNSLKDLRNQIMLITSQEDHALSEKCGIKSINYTLKQAQESFSVWTKNPSHKTMKGLIEKLEPSFFKLLDELTIARSRNHIKKFYDISKIGNFPERKPVISFYVDIDIAGNFPSYNAINQQIEKYKLSLYNPSAYVLSQYQNKYTNHNSNFKQIDREYYLIGMMKVNFLKRLESSVCSFSISLERTIKKINDLLKLIQDYQDQKTNSSQEEDLEQLMLSTDESEDILDNDEESRLVGKSLKFDLQHMDLAQWVNDLKSDKDSLLMIFNSAKMVDASKDKKLNQLKKLIKNKVSTSTPLNNENKKVLIFTAFADTAAYLYENIKEWAKTTLGLHSGLITGDTSSTKATVGVNKFKNILENFSPISQEHKTFNPNQSIDILIATDCISEGQNLQDCDYMINYDIHWNPVRIIQRFGRIDRLGSKNKYIQMVNFWPTPDLDGYIGLKGRVESRMTLVDITATGEENILKQSDELGVVENSLTYRNEQLKKLQTTVVDLEDMEETVSLTDFTLDDFRMELFKLFEKNNNALEKAPLGLYAIVPSSNQVKPFIKPGVIFCFAQKNANQKSIDVNPTHPYFLVYIDESKDVQFNYTNPKQILEIYRYLCVGKEQPYDALCELFNQETNHGSNMDKYKDLLLSAADQIIDLLRQKDFQMLMNGTLIIPEIENQINGLDDFELITWLIISDAQKN